MWPTNSRPISDPACADWIAELIDRRFTPISAIVPVGFEAYCRILHRAHTGTDRPDARWAEIAEHTGATIHPGVQWHRLIGIHENEGLSRLYESWNDLSPSHGQMSFTEFSALVRILDDHSTHEMETTMGFWEGYYGSSRHEPDRPSRAELESPRIRIGIREYIGVRCVFSEYARILRGPQGEPDFHPNVTWPDDRSWFVASEIDFDSTIVGGSAALIRDILADKTLEALPADPDLDLSTRGDTINAVPR